MKSPKETTLEEKILHSLRPELFGGEPLPYKIAEKLFSDPEVAAIQNHANTVSILRLGFNDHGPVHMRTVAKNAIKMLKLLNSKNIRTSLESEGVGTFTDSLCSVIFASMLHDLGMTIGRQDHEIYSIHLALPVIDRILAELLPKDLEKRVIIKSTAMEGIAGHMGTHKIHSKQTLQSDSDAATVTPFRMNFGRISVPPSAIAARSQTFPTPTVCLTNADSSKFPCTEASAAAE